MRTSPAQVISCFSEGSRLIFSPGFRRFILIPIALNLFIFILLSAIAFHYAQLMFANFEIYLPQWLTWIKWLLWPILAFLMLIFYGYCFNLLTTIIAAPFLGFLAEKVEAHITGIAPPDESLLSLIPRTFKRELIKLGYFIPRSLCMLLLLLALMLLPGANILGAIIGGLWGSWCLALQFCDYAADNHQLPFAHVRTQLAQQKLNSFAFGGLVLFGSMIPIINIVITPLSVAAGTIYWVKKSTDSLKSENSLIRR
jgi:CysZ protein